MDNTLQIGDRTYSFGTIPALEAVAVEVSIAKVIGEPLFKAFTEVKKPGVEAGSDDEAGAAGAAAIGLLLSKMDAAELTSTMKTVFTYVGYQGKTRVDINADFTGRNKELWQVFIYALRYNFSDFLPAGLFASIRSKLPK